MTFVGSVFKLRLTKDRREFVVDSPIRYEAAREAFDIPEGFRTDLGSVPWFARWLVPTWGPAWTLPYILHDFLCRNPTLVSRRDADGIMRRAIKEEGKGAWAPRILRWPAWVGVRIGSLWT